MSKLKTLKNCKILYFLIYSVGYSVANYLYGVSVKARRSILLHMNIRIKNYVLFDYTYFQLSFQGFVCDYPTFLYFWYNISLEAFLNKIWKYVEKILCRTN